ncbi:MAG: hypothetical protein Q4G04_02105 [bacterium]|nr:hypothetical protein [bacterium]
MELNMKYIVIINGTGGSGKDTFINFVSKYNKVYNVSSIDKVKEIATMIGWNGEKNEKNRKFLSDLKKLTTEYNDMAYNDIKEKVKNFQKSDNEIMFIHIREPENIAIASKELHALTLLLERNNHALITSNYSDASVKNYDYDMIIVNDTLEKLEEDAKNFYKKLTEIKKSTPY